MSRRLSRLSIPVAALLLLAASVLRAQEPAATKAAPAQVTITSTVPEAQAALQVAMMEAENASVLRADPHVRRALQLDPSCGMIRAIYATLAVGLSQKERLSELDRAVADAARATTPELLLAAALRELARGNQPQALAIIGIVRAQFPDDPFVEATYFGPHFNDLALVARLARDFRDRNPDQPWVYNVLGYTLHQSGHPTEGFEAIQHYIQLLPNHPNPHDTYAELLQRSGRLDEAAREYQRAIELDPGFTEADYGLAEVAKLGRDYKAAQPPLEAALARATVPDQRITALQALGFTAMYLGDMKTVRAQLTAAAAEADKAGLTETASWTRAWLAALEAAAGNARQAKQALADSKGSPGWMASWSVLLDATLGDVKGVETDLAAFKGANEPAPADVVPLLGVAAAVSKGELAAGRSELAKMKGPGNRVIAQALLLRTARKLKNAETAKAAEAEIAAYQPLDMASAFAYRVAGKE